MMQQKFLKRTVDELDVASTPGADAFEPGAKNDGASPAEKRTRFSVEIIQQLEFTTSGAAPQTQQISTNVTVKTVKSDAAPSSPKAAPPDLGALVECKVEQPEDSEFVDLEQCAAALEKDAAANGGATVFPGLSDLIGDESGDEIITSDALKHLISEISDDICDFPSDFMKDFDFDGDAPDDKSGVLSAAGAPPPQAKTAGAGGRYGAGGYPLSSVDVSTAAQALKHMAEQHQHKSQMGFVGRPPYPPDLDLGPATDYLGGGGGYATSKPPADKPEPAGAGMYAPPPQQPQQQQPPPPQGGGGYAQSAKATPPQYAPYGPGTGGGPQFRPQATGAGLSMSQAQQLTLQQSGGGAPQIQVSVGQHMQLSDMKPYFGQQATDASGVQYSVSQSQTINFTQQSLQQRARPMMHPQPPRAPPPEYKAGPNMQQRFAMRRPHQPMPPSGPMMRAQMLGGGGMYLPPQPHRVSGYVTPCQQRPPNVSIAPDGGMNLAGRQGDWRQLLVSQQQSALFRPGFQQQPQGSFTMAQLQQMAVSRGPVMQQQMPQGPGQMSVNLQMSQSMSLSSHHMPLYGNNSVNSQPPDLSLEFLELPPTSDSGHFSAQELLNSLDTSSSTFNLQDML